MNRWDNIPQDRITKDQFFAVIEIPRGSKQKYEYDEKIGMLRLDRILYTSTHYPANYGFIPHTLSNDGDALDVLVLSQESLLPMSLVECYPIGAFSMIDDNQEDEKIIAIPYGDPQMRSWTELEDLPEPYAHGNATLLQRLQRARRQRYSAHENPLRRIG